MTTATLSPFPPADFRLRRFTVVEYDRMVRDASIAESDRIELLDGWVVEKMPHNPPHDSAVLRLQRRLFKLLGDDWLVRGQSSVTLDTSVPEPDIAVVPGPEERFDAARPGPTDLVLVVEVSDSSLDRDRGFKFRLYARNRIAVYWIVNLVDRRIEVYSTPRGGKNPGYRTKTEYGPADAVPVVVGGKTLGSIPVKDVLP